MNDRTIWFIIGIVFLCLSIVLAVVYNRDKAKPDSPHAMVAAGLTRIFQIQEWKPGMGKQPLVYHPAAATTPVWRPLPSSLFTAAGG
ncbi:Magnetosome protein MamI with additionnal 2 TM helixes [Desulfamplus magnetovallimortis]|uniref:Magnetosome protein MamI with additionnal 2 TM helixes n=2 Tax=Desulfamplus magnetovallimortis TaxID=1246637 RepID=L0R581_9BACT|nr:Magnetosome protein MamI with additionnal 2 TM helixes [Desulfamplus magnetovallimortis BW-1]SLM32736.1 Magnetosome protein MamI with additionnal 2 TM helixes [Desulfamplus magnetovallimortis]